MSDPEIRRASARERLRRCAIGVVLVPVKSAALVVLGCWRLGLVDFITVSRLLALVPGGLGVQLRRCWYGWTLEQCGSDLFVDWMAVLKTPSIRIGQRVFIGSFSFVAESHLDNDVMVAHHTVIQGGPHTHGFDRLDVPIRQQPGNICAVTIGPDVWIGAGARILADVAPGTVVGAGAVVTRIWQPSAILAGMPARPIRLRGARTVDRQRLGEDAE